MATRLTSSSATMSHPKKMNKNSTLVALTGIFQGANHKVLVFDWSKFINSSLKLIDFPHTDLNYLDF